MRRVGVAQLKSRLSEYLRLVKRGGTVTVLDRDRPVARLVPPEQGDSRLVVRRPVAPGRIGAVELPPALAIPVDIAALLAEERGER